MAALKNKRRNAKATKIVEVVNDAVDNPNETDEQIIERMRERFEILDDMTQASIDGVVRGMVVTGPPGVGKSFGVEAVLEKNSLFDKLAGNKLRFEVIKGASSAIGLAILQSDAGHLLVERNVEMIGLLNLVVDLELCRAARDLFEEGGNIDSSHGRCIRPTRQSGEDVSLGAP